MHPVQRALMGFATPNPEELRALGVGFALAPHGLVVPIMGYGLPCEIRVASPGADSGLTLADIEQPDVQELLAREGLGFIADVTWFGERFYAGATAHASTAAEAVEALGTFVESSWPRRAIVAEAQRQSTGRWPWCQERTTTGGISIVAPTRKQHSKAMVSWSDREGELRGNVWVDRSTGWTRDVERALDHTPDGVAAVLRLAHERAGAPDRVHLAVHIAGMEATFTVAPAAGPHHDGAERAAA